MNAVGPPTPIRIAVHAMGGQGGGVLADWITQLALQNGYAAQATSVPGVAQRTGATIYYVEMMPRPPDGAQPVFALMPTPGDVDVVIAAELMEAGRAMLRGLVTPDRTTLIASSQRAYAVIEKEAPGDGTADSGTVTAAVAVAAKTRVVADFAGAAEHAGSVISSSLFGALAATGALPFERAAFEATIRDGGVGVTASLRAFAAGFALALAPPKAPELVAGKLLPDLPTRTGHADLDALLARIRRDCPAPAQPMAYAGVQRLVDFQDTAYAGDYLTHLKRVAIVDTAANGAAKGFALTTEVARQLARAMAYDDIIRVADLKTRAARTARVSRDVNVREGHDVIQTTEFFHPRMEEVCSVLPQRLGAALEQSPRLFRALDRLVDRGRRVRTDSIWGFMQLYLIAGRRSKRRATLRYGREVAHISGWLDQVLAAAPANADLAVELAKNRRLIKGYSDTMSRGLSKYDRAMAGAALVARRADAADWARRLRQAALLDEGGLALDGALRTIATLDGPAGPTKQSAAE
jgi:indolepyruvate ferredoxin oxidoreductase, beta subunit